MGNMREIDEMMELTTIPKIKLAITGLLEKYVLGQADNARLARLRQLFIKQGTSSLNFRTVAEILFPPVSRSRAAGEKSCLNMIKFQSRLRKILATAVEKEKLSSQEIINLVNFGTEDEKIIKVFAPIDIENIISWGMLDTENLWYPKRDRESTIDKTDNQIIDNLDQWLRSTSPILVFLTDERAKRFRSFQEFCHGMLLGDDKYATVPLLLQMNLCDMNPCRRLPVINEILSEIVERQFNLKIDFKMLHRSITRGKILPIFDLRAINDRDHTFERFGIVMYELRRLIEVEDGKYQNKIMLIMPKLSKFLQDPMDIDTVVLGPKHTGHRTPVYNEEDLTVIE